MSIRISQIYSKGVIVSKTQEAAIDISTRITRSIQFSSGNPTYDPSHICTGSDRFSYLFAKQLTDDPNQVGGDKVAHVLIQDSPTDCSTAAAIDAPSFDPTLQKELMPANMRLSVLTLTPVGSLYAVRVRVVYGDADLLCSPSANDCSSNSTATNLASSDLQCKSSKISGTQLCSVADISTIVQKRL
jgi:hypothetical protein